MSKTLNATNAPMRDVKAWPPNSVELAAANYDITGGCIFTWGDIIYNPDGVEIDGMLRAHESVHRQQQEEMGGPEIWWEEWKLNPAFRAEQEAQGYGKQYAYFCRIEKDRNRRDKYLRRLCEHLASGTYQLKMSGADARAAILKRAG